MPFDKPRLFSADGLHGENVSPPQSGSDRTLGFDLHQDQAVGDIATDQELGLSAELQVLAAHLRGEADALAERYAPAMCPTTQSVRDRRLGRRWIWQGAAAAVAGLALLAWRIDRWQESPPAAPHNAVAQIAAPGVIMSPQPTMHGSTVGPDARVPLAPPVLLPTPSKVAAADPAAIRHSQGIAEVGIDAPAVERHPPSDQIEMLRIQVLGFEKVIRKLQAEIVARDAAEIDSQRQIQSLQEEVAKLHKQLDDSRQ